MMATDRHFEVVPLEEYLRYAPDERVTYLHLHVDKMTDLAEDFCRQALNQETLPLAKWYLIRALGLLRSESAISQLVEVCLSPEVDFGNTSLHLICASSIGQIGDVALPLLLKAIESAAGKDTRKCLVDALGETRSPKAIPALYKEFKNEDYEIKLWASLSLSKIGRPALDTLYSILSESKDWREKVYVLDAICKIKDLSSAPTIKNILYKGTQQEKQFVLERGAGFFDQSFREPLELISKSGPPELAILAKGALTNLRP
jgi:HEAT repeat protein